MEKLATGIRGFDAITDGGSGKTILSAQFLLRGIEDGDGPGVHVTCEDTPADDVVILRNALENERRRCRVEVLKMRGASYQNGESPFTIDPGEGIVGVPLPHGPMVRD